MKKATDDMDAGLNNLNVEVVELQKKIGDSEKEIKLTNDRCLYEKVYNRRENLRFLGFPEATTTEKVASEVVYQFLERELERWRASMACIELVRKNQVQADRLLRAPKIPRPGLHLQKSTRSQRCYRGESIRRFCLRKFRKDARSKGQN